MRFLIDKRRHLLTALHDTVMAGLSLWLALYMRLGDMMLGYVGQQLPLLSVLCMSICLGVFSRRRLYRGLWRYASVPDLIAITKATTIALTLFYLVVFIATRLESIPRSVPFIQWLLLLAMLGGPRFVYRIWRDRKLGVSVDLLAARRVPVLLIGAGDRADLFLRDTRSGPSSHYIVIGIIDDNPKLVGHTIHGVRIYGGLDQLEHVLEKLARQGISPQRVILTYDSLEGSKIRALVDTTHKLGLPLARLPKLSEFKHGDKDKLTLQSIAVEDLLGRAQNVHDTSKISAFLTGKTVLVTGAGGTIGGELARQIASFNPKQLILFELSEYALYQIDLELARLFPTIPRVALIGDVRNQEQLEHVFAHMKPEVVFHAAAIKHVPLAEANVEEAVLTNVMGTKRIADVCAKFGTLVMVLISTDKAINPTNVMGAAKRAAETYCQALGQESKGKTRFIAVRFGNVLGSTGSVVPLFQSQLARGGPLTVTHPDMLRYFMTVREAVELVLQAATLGSKSGEVYVLDMGEPVKILDLALQMIRLAGYKPYDEIGIEFTGLRPGEKMFEELFYDNENSAKTAHASIWLANPRVVPMAEVARTLEELQAACLARNTPNVLALLHRLVPEYQRSTIEAA